MSPSDDGVPGIGTIAMNQAERAYVYAIVSKSEHARIVALAKRDGLSLMQFVRDCINDRLADESDDGALLEWRKRGRPPAIVKLRR